MAAVLILAPEWRTSSASQIVDQAAAVVDGEVITLSDLNWLIRYRNLEIPEDPIERRDFYLDTLNQIIEQKLIEREAGQTPGVEIRKEDVDAQMEGYRSRFQSEEEFRTRLREMEMNMEELRELIRRQLAVFRFIQVRFEPFIIVLPDQIEEFYHQELVPELERLGQENPSLESVEEQIRQLLTVRRVEVEMDRWVAAARRRAQVKILLFRDPTNRPNLPRELLDDWESKSQTRRPPAR